MLLDETRSPNEGFHTESRAGAMSMVEARCSTPFACHDVSGNVTGAAAENKKHCNHRCYHGNSGISSRHSRRSRSPRNHGPFKGGHVGTGRNRRDNSVDNLTVNGRILTTCSCW